MKINNDLYDDDSTADDHVSHNPVESLALTNYEAFHGLPKGTATID